MPRYFLSFFLLISLLACKLNPPDASPKIGNNPQAGHTIDLRGFKMYYETYGKGAPILLIHGNGGSIANLENQIPYFAKDHFVIAADSRAQGKSIDSSDSLSYEMMADDLSALLDSLHLDSCLVFGWSDGGINGLLLAMRHPEKVRKLAITGANLSPDSSAVDPFVWKWARALNDSTSALLPTTESKAQLKLLHLLSYEPHISIEQLSKITCPTLVIGGDHDVIRIKHTLQIAEAIPHAYLWIIPNSGHATPIHKKEQINRELTEFFGNPFRAIEGFERFE